MDAVTRRHFEQHIEALEERACSGDTDACKSLACMVLLIDPSDPEGGAEIIDLMQYLRAA